MRKFSYIIGLFMVLALVLAACAAPAAPAPTPTPAPAPAPAPTTAPSPGAPAAGSQVQKWIEAAKANGEDELVIWTNTWQRGDWVTKEFEAKYPFIKKVSVWDGRGSEIVNKTIEEYKVGRHIPDVIFLSGREIVVMYERAPETVSEYPFLETTSKWPEQPDHNFWSMWAGSLRVPTYNTNSISAQEAPKSWEDLIDAKWKGDIMMSTSGGDAPLLFAQLWGKDGELDWDKAFDYFDRLIKTTEPHVVRGFTSAQELHISGEFPIFAVNSWNSAMNVRSIGAPIAIVPVGTLVGSTWAVSLAGQPPSPNLARLWLDYMMSDEGLLRLADANFVPSMNPDLKTIASQELAKVGATWVPIKAKFRTAENVEKAEKWWGDTLRGKR